MITITILYPNTTGATFDEAYYLQKHIPMTRQLLAPALQGVRVELGRGGALPGSPAPYLALCHLDFASSTAFLVAFMPHAKVLQGDIPRYTNTTPVIQVSESATLG